MALTILQGEKREQRYSRWWAVNGQTEAKVVMDQLPQGHQQPRAVSRRSWFN